MDDEQLARALQSIGQTCFVKYYDLFANERVLREDVIETLKKETGYTENSCKSRATHARRIINAGREHDALRIINSSDSRKVTEQTREKARRILGGTSVTGTTLQNGERVTVYQQDNCIVNHLELFNWAIKAQTGRFRSEAILQTVKITAESTLETLRNEDFLSEIAPCESRNFIHEISDDQLLGALAVYLALHFDPVAKLAFEMLEEFQ